MKLVWNFLYTFFWVSIVKNTSYPKTEKDIHQLQVTITNIFRVFRIGFEPMTPTLSRWCSKPTELTER